MIMSRVLAFLYGVTAYAVSFATLLYAIGFVEGAGVPKGIDDGVVAPMTEALVVNLLLLSLFAVQHSVMARAQFKAVWTRLVPKSIERSTYIAAASLALIVLYWQWRPMPGVIWQASDPQVATAITGLSLLGWLLVLLSTFFINHFELFGLQQVFNNLVGRDMPTPRFRVPALYKLVRHPLYLGLLIAFWAAPVMTAGHLLFTAVNTFYILIAIRLEERDLIDAFGEEYRRYRARVSMLLPWRKSA
jgi:methanethiol S-methyltransferase